MMGSPSTVDITQLRELNIEFNQKTKELLSKDNK